jgi:ubiquinone/menaquinone biosynthesis C-methylase UbiE
MLELNYSTLIDPLLRPLRRLAPDFAGLQPPQSVLDVCCGTGAQAFEYARHGLNAVGIDLDPGMLKLAASYMRQAGGLKLTLQTADASELPFPAASFDAASICLALHEKDMALQDMVILEMRRVVRPGGKLVFMDYAAPLPAGWRPILTSIEYLAGQDHYRSFRHYTAFGGLEAILRKHHIKVVRERRTTANNLMLCLAVNE